jgi:hypothetical protein
MNALTLTGLFLSLLFSTAPVASPAEQAVIRFFQAVDAGDCETLRALTTRAPWQDRCSEAIQEMRGHGTRLLRIEGSQPDGRDPRTQLVRARVHHSRGEHVWVLSVKPVAEGWRIAI